MITLAFTGLPAGQALLLPDRQEKIPEPFREAVLKEFASKPGGSCALAAYDAATGLVALYNGTGETWTTRDIITEIVLNPILPAKGPGGLEIGWTQVGGNFPIAVAWSEIYNEPMRAWMRKKAKALAQLLDKDFREATPSSDC